MYALIKRGWGKDLIDYLNQKNIPLITTFFVVAFFAVAFGASLPDLFVGVSSALNGIPELSFGDVISGNVIDLTLAVALAVFISRSAIHSDSKLVKKSALFTSLIAVLPLFLVLDGILSKGDGLVLISAFLLYAIWVFLRGERFHKVYDGEKAKFKDFFLLKISLIQLLLILKIKALKNFYKNFLFFF